MHDNTCHHVLEMRLAQEGTGTVHEDATVQQRVQRALSESSLMALRRLIVERDDDRLIISGRVATFYQKQQAQELVRTEANGLQVVNDIEVS